MSAEVAAVPMAVAEAATAAAPVAAVVAETAVTTAVTVAETTASTAAQTAETVAPILKATAETVADVGTNAAKTVSESTGKFTNVVGETSENIGNQTAEAASELASAGGDAAESVIPEAAEPITDATDLEQRVADVRVAVAENEAGSANSKPANTTTENAQDQSTAGEATSEVIAPAADTESSADTKTQTKAEGDNNANAKQETENTEQQTAESQVYIPSALRNDPDFQRRLGEAVAQANADGNTDLNAITKKALDEQYADWAKKNVDNPPAEAATNEIYLAILAREQTLVENSNSQTLAILKALAEWKHMNDTRKDVIAETDLEKRMKILKKLVAAIINALVITPAAVVVGSAREGVSETTSPKK
jgi:hypothetical protein